MGTSSRPLQIAMIAVLAVIAIGLSVLALGQSSEPVESAGQTPGFTEQQSVDAGLSDPVASPDESGEENAVDEPEEDVPFTAQPTQRIIQALSPSVLMRANTGACPTTPAVAERSFDGGQTWSPEDLSAVFPISALHRFVDLGNDVIAAVGWDPENCDLPSATAGYMSTPGVWNVMDADGFWRINPIDSAILQGPAGATIAPGCSAVQLGLGTSERIGVLCEDATVSFTPDEGATWVRSDVVTGADSVLVTSTSTYVAVLGDTDCDGVGVRAFDDAMRLTAQTCVAGLSASQGDTAMTFSDDGVLWLWAGDSLVRSTDGGQTWG